MIRLTSVTLACVLGLLPDLLAQDPIFILDGDNPHDNFGISVADVGDMNQDGVPDFIIGIWGDSTIAASAGSAQVISGAKGTPLYTVYGAAASDNFGVSVAGAGDVNIDGYTDFIVGIWGDDTIVSNAGAAHVYSGFDGTLFQGYFGSGVGDRFGLSVNGAGDVNLDGFDDVIVGAYLDDNSGTDAGSATVFSSVTGIPMYQFNGDSPDDLFGYSVGVVGDVNNDGRSDVIVGAYADDNAGNDSGSIKVFSGIDGSVVHAINGLAADDWFGSYVSFAGDVDADLVPDFIVGADGSDANGIDSGSAQVFSGKTGALLHTFVGDSAGDSMGYPCSYAGDIDNDGHADLIVGSYAADKGGIITGMARVYAGKTGQAIHTWYGEATWDDFGIGVSNVGDVNGDGTDDVVVGADLMDYGGAESGRVIVYSGKKLDLTTDTHVVSLSSGGQQIFSLDAGTGNAFQNYWILGSFTGTSPGTPLGSALVPLNLDQWMLMTIAYANTPLLPGFNGKLDSLGQASAALVVPPGTLASLAGFTLHHAFALYDASTVVFHASNAVPMTLVP